MQHSEQLLEIQLARTALKERIEHLNRLILSSKSSGVNSSRNSLLPGAGHMSALSIRSSASNLHPSPRPFSTSSGVSSVSTAINGCNSDDVGDDDSTGEYGDGNATLGAQVRALQADVADKNRYIATLEKRLLQARRSSQSRTSLGFNPPHKIPGSFSQDLGIEMLLKEKDEEIAELRARLEDKERMVTALRNAARKRDAAECGGRGILRNSKTASMDGVGVLRNSKTASMDGVGVGVGVLRSSKTASMDGVGGVGPGGRGPGVGVRARTSSDSITPLRTKNSLDDSVAPLRTRASADSVAPLRLRARGSSDSVVNVAENVDEDGTF